MWSNARRSFRKIFGALVASFGRPLPGVRRGESLA